MSEHTGAWRQVVSFLSVALMASLMVGGSCGPQSTAGASCDAPSLNCNFPKVVACIDKCQTPVLVGGACSTDTCDPNGVCVPGAECTLNGDGTTTCETSGDFFQVALGLDAPCEPALTSISPSADCANSYFCRLASCQGSAAGAVARCGAFTTIGGACDSNAEAPGCSPCEPGTTCVTAGGASSGFCQKQCATAADCPCNSNETCFVNGAAGQTFGAETTCCLAPGGRCSQNGECCGVGASACTGPDGKQACGPCVVPPKPASAYGDLCERAADCCAGEGVACRGPVGHRACQTCFTSSKAPPIADPYGCGTDADCCPTPPDPKGFASNGAPYCRPAAGNKSTTALGGCCSLRYCGDPCTEDSDCVQFGAFEGYGASTGTLYCINGACTAPNNTADGPGVCNLNFTDTCQLPPPPSSGSGNPGGGGDGGTGEGDDGEQTNCEDQPQLIQCSQPCDPGDICCGDLQCTPSKPGVGFGRSVCCKQFALDEDYCPCIGGIDE